MTTVGPQLSLSSTYLAVVLRATRSYYMGVPALRSGLSPEQRTAIRQGLVRLTEQSARSFGCTAEAVVQELRYWQPER
jgi:hypothetical protein